ncbi:hypothetical protein ACLB2K_077459 [Fragaria x ananassa]
MTSPTCQFTLNTEDQRLFPLQMLFGNYCCTTKNLIKLIHKSVKWYSRQGSRSSFRQILCSDSARWQRQSLGPSGLSI